MKFLDRFKTAAKPAQQEEDANMSNTPDAANAADERIAELSASLETATTTLTATEQRFAEMQSKFDAMSAQMTALEAEKVSLADKAKAVVQAARKEKLEVVLGTVGAAPVLASLEGADDTTFETVLGAFSANREAEGKSKMFKEEGVAAEVETPVEEADTATRLASKIAAQYKTEGNK